jgi:hypothetical protein
MTKINTLSAKFKARGEGVRDFLRLPRAHKNYMGRRAKSTLRPAGMKSYGLSFGDS